MAAQRAPTSLSTMPALNWRETFLTSLSHRDKREHAHDAFIDAYQHLASQITSPIERPSPTPLSLSQSGRSSSGRSLTTRPSDDLARLRADLLTAQTSQATLHTQIKTLSTALETLRAEHAGAQRTLKAREAEKKKVVRRLGDLEEEVKVKTREIQRLQDEMLALNIEVNVKVAETARVREENESLTKRWVRKMEQEAEEMNRGSGWT